MPSISCLFHEKKTRRVKEKRINKKIVSQAVPPDVFFFFFFFFLTTGNLQEFPWNPSKS